MVTAADLVQERFVAFEKNLPIRKAIDKALRHRGARIEAAMEFDNIETIKQAIAINSGVSILPRPSVSREIENRVVAAVPIDMTELVRPIGIIHRRQKLLTPTAATAPPSASAARATSRAASAIALASNSTRPGAGDDGSTWRWWTDTTLASGRTTAARTPDVPTSTTRIDPSCSVMWPSPVLDAAER